MSPKILVLPLAYLCIRRISNLLIQLLSDDEGLNYEDARYYLSDATYEVLQEILKNILNSPYLDAATRFSSLEVLLRNDVRKLDTGIFPHSYYEKILRVIISNGNGLRQLNLKGVWARDHPLVLAELVSSLKNIKVLIMPHIVNDFILQRLAECENLTVLDISGEASFTAHGLVQLKNNSLRVLEIGNYGKKEICEDNSDDTELICELIQNLQNLQSIRTYSFTGKSLFLLQGLKRCSRTKMTYLHDTGTTADEFDAIVTLCPQLEYIYLDSPKETVVNKLKQLKRLNCLKLTKPSPLELIEYLQNSASNIEIIKINHYKTQELDLSVIAIGSPGIKTLEFYQSRLILSNPDVFFMFLNNVEILYGEISDESLRQLLVNSPSLKRILVGCVINFTDGDIFRICAECDLSFLEELWFSYAKKLTIMSVELLMGHCPNLKVLGQISEWDITSDELDFFRSVIQLSNIDLTLLPTNV